MTIMQRIAECDNGIVAAWENKAADKRLEVRKSLFWTRRRPCYLTMCYAGGVFINGHNGLSRRQAARAVSIWLDGNKKGGAR